MREWEKDKIEKIFYVECECPLWESSIRLITLYVPSVEIVEEPLSVSKTSALTTQSLIMRRRDHICRWLSVQIRYESKKNSVKISLSKMAVDSNYMLLGICVHTGSNCKVSFITYSNWESGTLLEFGVGAMFKVPIHCKSLQPECNRRAVKICNSCSL